MPKRLIERIQAKGAVCIPKITGTGKANTPNRMSCSPVEATIRSRRRDHLLLFWLPIAGAAAGVVLALRPSPGRRPIDGGLACVLLVASFVFLGVFPRADFNHLMNVYQPAVVAAVLVVHRLLERAQRPTKLPFRGLLVLASLVAASYVMVATARR